MVDQDRVVAALPAYEVGSELGRGASGVVLAGRHRQLGRLVAIKQLPVAFGTDPAVRARFLAEARVLATLDHPHVVAIYDFVDYDGLCLLVMERLTGGTVWSRFHAGGFTSDVSCAILLALCAGLHNAHQHGILHRDVKPENLMFSGEGTLKVTDLGIAKVIGGSATLATRHGEVLGTPAYIAPEQAQGYELTPATDVYAAGTVLYELLAGRLPFPADTDPATILYRHVHEEPPPLLEIAHAVPAELAEATDRAISKAPEDRFQSAEEFGVAIATCAAHTWGRGWLARTNVPVSASGPILAAALGELQMDDMPRGSTPTPRIARAKPEPVGDFVPIQLLHPELRDSYSGNADPLRAAATIAPGTEDPLAAPASLPPETATPHPSLPPTPLTPPPSAPPSAPSPSAVGGDGDRDGARDVATPESAPARPRRNRVVIGVAIVALLALVGALLAVLNRSNNHSSDTAAAGGGKRAAVATAVWMALQKPQIARQQVASTVAQGRLWVLGGITSGTSTAKVEGFDPAIGSWTSGPDLPAPLHHAMAVTYHDDIVVMGGWIPSGGSLDGTVSNRVYALHNGAWIALPPLHHPRAAGAAAVVGNNIVVVGGQANHQLVSPTEVFDGTAWHDAAPMPTRRDHLAAVSDGRFLYAVGGRALSSAHNTGALERFDPIANRWQALAPLPTPRGGLGAALVGAWIVTAGGESPTGVFSNVEAYNLASGRWSELPPMKTPRHGLAMFANGNVIYLVDGATAAGHTDSIASDEALDLASWAGPSRWRALPPAPTARQQLATTAMGGSVWVLGGLTNGAASAKVEGFDPAIGAWTHAAHLPIPLHHAMAVTYHGEIVVMGGWIPNGGTLDATTSNRVYALRDGAWVALPSLHHARAAGAAAVVGNRIVVAGGQANHKLVAPTEVFDGKAWKDVAPLPTPRDHLAGASDGKYFYAVGGRLLGPDKNVGAFERYDPAANRWEELPSLPTPRGGLGATVLGNTLLTIGGESPTGLFDNVEAFDIGRGRWSVLAPMRTPRHGMGVATVGDTIYVIGGAAAAGHTHSVPTNEALTLR